MLYANPRSLLEASATADLMDPEVSEEVKEVIEDLGDVLDNNVEEVAEEDKTTNGGIPVVAEAVAMYATASNYGSARYLVTLESVMAIMETEGELAAKETMEDAPTEEDVAECEPEPKNVIEDIADKNNVDPEDVAVVISTETARFLAQTALLEAKHGKKGKNAKATKKLKKMKAVIDKLKQGKIKLVKA